MLCSENWKWYRNSFQAYMQAIRYCLFDEFLIPSLYVDIVIQVLQPNRGESEKEVKSDLSI